MSRTVRTRGAPSGSRTRHRKGLLLAYLQLAEMPKDARCSEKQRRGRELETVLHDLLIIERLDPRTHYRPEGEEVDGSFWLDGRAYLLEAKWHQEPLPASSIYMFKGKVDGKLDGTIGIFISMSGFSEEAVEALSHGKKLNIILFDRNDVEACILGKPPFKALMRRKLRAAAEEGIVYLKSPPDTRPNRT